MGLFFNLYIDFGQSQEGRNEMRDFLVKKERLVAKSGSYEMTIYDNHYTIGVTVLINETSKTGLYSNEQKTFATEIGYAYFDLLKSAPDFRYALVGEEAGEWVDGQDILSPEFDGYLPTHGMVVNNDLCPYFDYPFVAFKEGYSWLPYLGEFD